MRPISAKNVPLAAVDIGFVWITIIWSMIAVWRHHKWVALAKNILRTGKKVRPKTAVKGKRFLCAICRKRSPKPVKTPAPWYCPNCLKPLMDSE